MTCVCRRYYVQKIKMAAVLQMKINNYNLETRMSFLLSVAVMFPIMDMANKIIRNSDDKFHKFFISKVSAQ